MSAFEERRAHDVQKLRQLAGEPRSPLKVVRVSGWPPSEIELEIHLKTAPSRQYPCATQDVTRFTVSLPSKYPLAEPTVTISTPILHPNVYTSGRICLGMKWLPTYGLDLLIRRIAQIIIFDPTILNEQSPANRDALEWYRDARRRHPSAFPSDVWAVSGVEPQRTLKWSDVSSAPAKAIFPCVSCGAKLSLPAGRSGQVKCPQCGKSFEVRT